MKKINIILPVYNESESIISFLELLEENIQKLNYEFLVTIVDDGSVDTTWDDIYNFEFKSDAKISLSASIKITTSHFSLTKFKPNLIACPFPKFFCELIIFKFL